MELTLVHQNEKEISVTCDGQRSHTFDLRTLILSQEKELSQPIDDPVAFGKAVYLTLFPSGTVARHALEIMPERILLVTPDKDLDVIPWEYAYSSDGFLVTQCHFVRGLPTDQRIDPPMLDNGLHIVAIPSSPLSTELPPLNIDGEWQRLKEIIKAVPSAVTLERTRPPTIEQLRTLLVNRRQRVVHFMGHGGQDEAGAILCFEKENGDLEPVTARQFALRVRGTTFLVTLNACVSATPGATSFSNLAAALVQQKTPYALGMRLSIHDEDARAFSRVFYSDLARGSPVEEALFQARLVLADSPRSWVVGVPVLYTSLKISAPGFPSVPGTPVINEHQPRIEISALPRAEGIFHGRLDELKQLGTSLTGDNRLHIVTIHGGGGQGKTALAREAVERFAHAWSGGVWATTLENLPSREIFVSDLARFLDIPTQEILDPTEIERRLLALLSERRLLIVLDNADTMVDAVEANNELIIHLAQLLQQLPGSAVSLLVTSRVPLGWSGEELLELDGLSPKEGAALFLQSTSHRAEEVDMNLARQLSKQVAGHPLSLRLLGGAFNVSAITLPAFLKVHEEQLAKAENKYVGLDHRHRTLFACIETSVHYLDTHLHDLLSGLWVFHAPFLAEMVIPIFDPEHKDTETNPSPVRGWLYTLWQRSLLTRETLITREGRLEFYFLLPTVRPYIKHELKQVYEHEMLLSRFGAVYARLADILSSELDKSEAASAVVRRISDDFEQGVTYITGVEHGGYLLRWGWIQHRIGNPRRGLPLLEQALEIAQEDEGDLEAQALNSIAGVYKDIGQPQRALIFYEQALSICQQKHDRAGEATALHGLASTYLTTGQSEKAFVLFQQTLPIIREVGDRASEAAMLSDEAAAYQATGQLQKALHLYKQVLSLMREVGDRAGEATVLNNIAGIYRDRGQFREALLLCEYALSIAHEVGDLAGTAIILNNKADVYRATDHLQEALEVWKQTLPIMREVDNRPGEAATLNNMALVYRAIGQLDQALALYEQALSIRREVGDRVGEAVTLNNIGEVYKATGQPQRALEICEKALSLTRQGGDRAGEATVLYNMASLLYRHLNQTEDAIVYAEQAITVMQETGLSHDAAGDSLEDLQQTLYFMRTGASRYSHTNW